MKKRTLAILVIMLVSAALFAGGKTESTAGGAAGESTATQFVFGTSGVGGSWYPVAVKIGAIIGEETKYKLIVQASGGGLENLRLLKSKEFTFGWAESNVAHASYNGKKLFEKEGANKNLRYMYSLWPGVLQPLVHKTSGIKTFYDMKGKSISPGSAGSGNEIAYIEILEIYGLSPKDMQWKPMQHTEREMAFKDRQLDLIGYQTSVPSSSIMSATTQNPCQLLPIEGKERDALIKKQVWPVPITIPAGTYNGQTEAVETIGDYGAALCDASVPADFVYEYLKAMYRRVAEIHAIHASAKQVLLETALIAQGPIPLHPGAEKFYKEMGLIK